MIVAAVLLFTTGAAYSVRCDNSAPVSKYRSSLFELGDVTQTVTATGTINPVALVNVGSLSRHELEVASANVKVAESQVARIQADLGNSLIRSPIDGIVIKRWVDLGQTLAATFTTPNLFQIAQNLTKMRIDTSISEADIGSLTIGQDCHRSLRAVAPCAGARVGAQAMSRRFCQ